MIKFKAKEQPKVTPQRKAAEQLLQQLKRTLEMEAGRGNITINHFLTSRGSEDRNAFAPQTQPGTGFYTLEGVVATGGMGAVLKAQDNNLARTVALKVMLNSADANDQTVFSFVAEAQITGQLEHPNIVPLHDIGVAADGTIYYTMKLIEGRTLRDILKDIREGNADTIQRFPISRLLTIFQKVCDGISYAHSRRVIHRDLKPDNVMVGEFGEVLILDWGLAKVLPEPGQADTEEHGGEFSGPLPGAPGGDAMATMAGQVKGTPNYMAPEQAEGRVADIDTRSDIYALGGILYYTLTMQPPVTGANLDEILTRVTSGDITSPSSFNSKPIENPSGKTAPHCPDGTIPDALSAVAMKCMARESALRYQTVEELQADLAAYQGGYATRAQDANMFTLLRLLFQRNKKEVFMAFGALILVFVVALGFLGKVKLSEIKAQEALTKAKATVAELRETAPSMAAVAEGKLRELKFAEAMTNINQAIKLDDSVARFHNIKGNIFLSLLEIQEAREAFEKAREIDTKLTDAIRSSVLCAAIIRDNPDLKKLNDKSKRDIYELFREQGRIEEAGRIFAMVAATDTQVVVGFRRQLAAAQIKPELLERDGSGRYSLDLSENPVSSLAALQSIPLASLNLAGCTNVSDLGPLKGMPLMSLNLARLNRLTDLAPLKGMQLTELNLRNCDELLDLAPLAGMPLTLLDLSDTKIVDINPLTGIKLEWLDLSDCSQVRDIKALAGMPLRWLKLDRTRVINIGAIRGAPLQFISFNDIRVSDISALTNMPLVTNLMSKTLVRDITALKGMRLQHLDCYKTPVQSIAPLAGMTSLRLLDLRETGITTISPLAGMPLDVLKLALTQVSDIEALRGAPLTVELDLSETRVASLEPLRGAPLQYLNLSKAPVSSLAPLAGMPLKVLRMDSLPTQPDLNPLWDCQELEQLAIPFPSPSVIALRQLPKLKRLDYYVPLDLWERSKTPPQFWKDWDARKQ
ncbi:MAG: protein kinase [Verrucomicrobia bacterium]|nr:protein kinase [Verrucomicrobiota bacterium]